MKLNLQKTAPILAAFLMFVSLGAWSISSPVGSSPDDDFHLASIWCGQGIREGLCEQGEEPNTRLVPSKVISSVCYAFNPTVTADCQGEKFQEQGFSFSQTSRVNTGSQYPGGYYFVVSFFAGENIVLSTLAVRIFNSIVFIFLLLLTWLALPFRHRWFLPASVVVTFIPLGMFTIASVNPSSWSLTSAAILFPSLIGWYSSTGIQKLVLGFTSLFAALIGVLSRGDSGAYLVIAAIAAGILAFKIRRDYVIQSILPMALIIIGLASFFSVDQTTAAVSGEIGVTSDTDNQTSKVALTLINLVSIPSLFNGVFGLGWGLGWLDTTVPSIVPGIGMFVASGLLFTSLRSLQTRRFIALLGIGAAMVIIPVYILVQSSALVGQEVQPRYILPLVTMLVAASIAPRYAGLNDTWLETLKLSRLQFWLISLGVSVSQAISLFSNLRRYVTTGSYYLNGNTEWWWNTGPSPILVFGLGSISFALLMVLFAIHGSSTNTLTSFSDKINPNVSSAIFQK